MLTQAVHTWSIPVWTVFFMKKLIKFTAFCMAASCLVWFGTVLADRQSLNEDLIRLHVVGASDRAEDQTLKLKVRDALTDYLREAMEELPDAEAAEEYLRERLDTLRDLANSVLAAAGSGARATVTLRQEAFPTRDYDTFSLPAGVYKSLRVTIGEGAGRNWWCVVFPGLCVPAASDGFETAAAGAGFGTPLTGALRQEPKYEVRFFLLDVLGRVQNWLFK